MRWLFTFIFNVRRWRWRTLQLAVALYFNDAQNETERLVPDPPFLKKKQKQKP